MFGFNKNKKDIDADKENVYHLYMQKCEQVDFLTSMINNYEEIVKHLHCCIEYVTKSPQQSSCMSEPPIHVTPEDFVKIMSDFMPSLNFDPERNG